MREKPEIVCLCGSTKFKGAFQKANFDLTMKGFIVLSVGAFAHAEGLFGTVITEKDKINLDELHKRKIDLCDWVYVLDVGGYIGSSTRSEIEYATKNSKPIFYLSVDYPDYQEPASDTQKMVDAIGAACRMMEEACEYRDRAEYAESEVKRLQAENRKMRGIVGQAITILYNEGGPTSVVRLFERAYAESQNPCIPCKTRETMCAMGLHIADLHTALSRAATFAPGCPPERYDECRDKPEGSRPCAECWEGYLLEQAREKREAATGYVSPLKAENERLRSELREIKALVRQNITPRFAEEGEADE